MWPRSKILVVFGIVYVVISGLIYFGLRFSLKKNFSKDLLSEMLLKQSVFRETTTDLCRYQILGDPKEKGNYVKLEIECKDGKKAYSTMSLSAVEDKTIFGLLTEYARIIGFDKNLVLTGKLACYLDGKAISMEMGKEKINPMVTIRCSEK